MCMAWREDGRFLTVAVMRVAQRRLRKRGEKVIMPVGGGSKGEVRWQIKGGWDRHCLRVGGGVCDGCARAGERRRRKRKKKKKKGKIKV